MGGTLRHWQRPDLVDAATLLVSELVSNAVLHARTPIRVLVVQLGDRVRIEVHDGTTRAPARKHYSALATTGRGLLLVQRLSADWGVEVEDDGKRVWFELAEPSGEDAVEADLSAVEDLEDLEWGRR